MTSLDYFLTTDIELTKEMISDGLPRELTPQFTYYFPIGLSDSKGAYGLMRFWQASRHCFTGSG